MIDGLIKVLLFQAFGEGIAFYFSLPVPGPVIGMLLLFLYLMARKNEAEKMASFSAPFLRHLALLFVPAAVGIMLHAQRVADEWLPIAAALIISTIVTIIVTALVIRLLKR